MADVLRAKRVIPGQVEEVADTASNTVDRGADSVSASSEPSGLAVYIGYEAGKPGYARGGYNNYASVVSRFPGKKYISVGRDAIDVEPGLASASQVVAFVRGWKQLNTNKPVIYASQSNMSAVKSALTSAGIARSQYYLWVAAWNNNPAIPSGYDAIQYASNNSYDSDSFYDYMFGGTPTPPPPPASEWPMTQGSTYTADVKTLQTNLNTWASVIGLTTPLTVDGNFGPLTAAAVTLAQQHFGEHGVAAGSCSQAIFNDLKSTPGTTPPPVNPPPVNPPPVNGDWGIFDQVRALTVLAIVADKVNSANADVRLSWESPTGPKGAPGIAKYQIAVCEGAELTGPQIATYPRYRNKSNTALESPVVLTGLTLGKQYAIGVRAMLADGSHAGKWVTVTVTATPGLPTPPSNDNVTAAILALMLSKVGDRYTETNPDRFGPNQFDCSGLVWYASTQSGLAMPGGPSNPVAALVPYEMEWLGSQPGAQVITNASQVQKGDFVAFTGASPAPFSVTIGGHTFPAHEFGHIGMATSSTEYVSAYDTAEGVKVKPISGDVFNVAVRLSASSPTPPAPTPGTYPSPSTAVGVNNNLNNGKIMYGFFRQNGYSPMQAAGAIASIWGESQWNPESAGTGGRGLIGWTPASTLPNSAFTGNAASDMAAQLNQILTFVRVNGDQGTVNSMANAATITAAAELWGRGVERYGIDDVHSQGVAYAAQIAKALDGVTLAQ